MPAPGAGAAARRSGSSPRARPVEPCGEQRAPCGLGDGHHRGRAARGARDAIRRSPRALADPPPPNPSRAPVETAAIPSERAARPPMGVGIAEVGVDKIAASTRTDGARHAARAREEEQAVDLDADRLHALLAKAPGGGAAVTLAQIRDDRGDPNRRRRGDGLGHQELSAARGQRSRSRVSTRSGLSPDRHAVHYWQAPWSRGGAAQQLPCATQGSITRSLDQSTPAARSKSTCPGTRSRPAPCSPSRRACRCPRSWSTSMPDWNWKLKPPPPCRRRRRRTWPARAGWSSSIGHRDSASISVLE